MTLRLSPSFYKRLLLYPLLTIVGLMLIEAVLRILLPHWDFLPPRSYGLQYRRLEVQLARLDQLVADYGAVDCIFIGSSLVEHGIDPARFEAAYQAALGEKIHCFTMGLGSITASGQAATVEMLIHRYHPALIVVGTEARAYNEAQLLKLGNHVTQAEQHLPDEAWMRYQRGDWTLQGWLFDQSGLAQAYQLVGAGFRLDAQNETLAQALAQTRNGYTPLRGQVVEVSQTVNRIHPQEGDLRHLAFFAVYNMAANDLAGLQRMAQLGGGDNCRGGHLCAPTTQIVILEMPVHPSYLDYFAEGSNAHQRFIQTVRQIADAEGVLFWQSTPQASALIPAEGWNDRYHVNELGTPILTNWLAEQIINAIQTGTLRKL